MLLSVAVSVSLALGLSVLCMLLAAALLLAVARLWACARRPDPWRTFERERRGRDEPAATLGQPGASTEPAPVLPDIGSLLVPAARRAKLAAHG